MRRLLLSLVLLILGCVAAHAQSTSPLMIAATSCAHSPRQGTSQVCYDTTGKILYVWDETQHPPAFVPMAAPPAPPPLGALLAQNNLSDLASASTARTNLGLGALATGGYPAIGVPGLFSPLEQFVPHALPVVAGPSTLACTGATGQFPYQDVYSGTLNGSNVFLQLPASGCADFSIITVRATQDGGHTLNVSTAAGGGLLGTPLWNLGTTATNQILEQFIWDNPDNGWILLNVTTIPLQPLPVGAGGRGTAGPATLASLGTCATGLEGATGTQTDSLAACQVGVVATTGGSTHCPVYCNGTNWIQINAPSGTSSVLAPAMLASLGSCGAPQEGLFGTETDSSGICSLGASATSGGSTHCPVYCNGTAWIQLAATGGRNTVRPDTIANLGTCTAARVGTTATETESTGACSIGSVATTGGSTVCQIYCNGVSWVQTGL